MPDTRTGHVSWPEGHWDVDYAVSDSEGLALLNGRFRGTSVIGKFSLPVIRVKYLKDARSGGAGPFADQISWKLGGTHGLQRIANRNNEYVGLTTYAVGETLWLEISVYARIGAYHLAQQWHLSEHGAVLPRLWSKGLHANIDHTHHPYWRLDFDVDEANHNRVLHHDDGKGWFFYPRESHDRKVPEVNRVWFVQHRRTGNGAWILPGANDGHVDDFSRIDMGVHLFRRSTEADPWPFGTGGLRLPGHEPVDDADIVFWYVAHLFHRAAEGGDHWHFAGPTILLELPPVPPPPRNFGITLRKQRNQTGGELTVDGTGFTPGGQVHITYANVPNRPPVIDAAGWSTVDGAGHFTHWERIGFTSSNHEDAFREVTVAARDVATGHVAKATTSATIWAP